MSPYELQSRLEVRVFLGKVLREVPVHYRFKLDIRDELLDHLQCAVDDLTDSGMGDDEAVKIAVTSMGSPVALGKYYMEAYKGREGYKTGELFMFLRRWGCMIVWLFIFCLSRNSDMLVGVSYSRCLFFAVPAAVASYFCARNLCKWQNAVCCILAPVPFLILFCAVAYNYGELNTGTVSAFLDYSLCWVVPSAVVFAFVAIPERMREKPAHIYRFVLVCLCTLVMVYGCYDAVFYTEVSETAYSMAATHLADEIDAYVQSGYDNPERMYSAADTLDYFLNKCCETALFDPHSNRITEIFSDSEGEHQAFSFRTFLYCAVQNAKSAEKMKYVRVSYPFSVLITGEVENDSGRISHEEFLTVRDDYYARVSDAIRGTSDMRGVIDLAFDIQCMEFNVQTGY